MKKILIVLLIIISGITAKAQFKMASLQASGLTCAMCSKAINNSLEELSFIQSVKADIKNSAFNVTFRPGVSIEIDEMKKAVEDAGFSVAKLKLAGNFDHVDIKNDGHVLLNGNTFHFLNVKDQSLAGEKQITIVDKHFLTAREFKKFSLASQMQCVQTGKAGGCCKKEGIAENTRIYHATI